MSKRPTIDRDKVLDAAESVVMQQGVAALSIGEVAKAAAISKGGVQSCFGTKDRLIEAMFKRWRSDYEAAVQRLEGEAAAPLQRLRAHVALLEAGDEASIRRAAAVMAAMQNQAELRQQASAWYRPLMLQNATDDDEGRNTRLAFLAAKGAFLLRSFGLMEISDSEWQAIFSDIRRLLERTG